MRFLWINHAQNAYQSLRSRRVRSALTMLGVTIGIASITTILSLSGGINQIINSQVKALDGNIAIIRPGAKTNSPASISQINLGLDYTTSTLTENDITYIKNTPHVESVSPIMILSGTIKADSTAPNDSQIIATTFDLNNICKIKLREGNFFSSSSDQNIAVIGTQLSINIFGSESSIGRIFTIRGQDFTVTGVMDRVNNPINYNSIDFDNAAIINFVSGKKLNQDLVQIQQINIKSDTPENLNQTIESITKTLSASHNGENDFSVLSGDQVSQPTSHLFYLITSFTTAIASISLIVGGIGIMNIMLVTVAERTREIGIRKALGATNSDISWQFLIESLAISIGGGIAGYFMGYIIAFGISRTFLTFDPSINWQVAAIDLLVSIIMGAIFGLYPAIRAARKDPIESLYQS